MIPETPNAHPLVSPPPAPVTVPVTGVPPPGMISVMCPTGLTPYAVEGLHPAAPLFARVTYLPERRECDQSVTGAARRPSD